MTTHRATSRRSRRRRTGRTGWHRFVPGWRLVLGTVLTGLLLLLGGFFVGYALVDVPDPNKLADAQTSIVYYSDGTTELGRFGPQNRQIVGLDDIPEHLQHAVLAAENRSFYTDSGISPKGIARALWTNVVSGSTQGGSTITQQYVKNTYLTQDRTWTRKAKEFFITIKVDKQLSKDEILADYLNTIYFGRGAYGIQTAARTYFGKDVSQISVDEGAVLASILRSPGRYDPAIRPANVDRLEGRFHYVLKGMVAQGWLPASYDVTKPVPELKKPTPTNRLGGPKGYLLASVRDELSAKGFSDVDIDLGGLRVVSTFDKKAQASAEKAVKDGFPTKNAKDVHVGLAAVEPGTGAVKAMYGGADYVSRQFNNATDAAPQAGSTFKSFALAAALEKGVSLESRFAGNSPYRIKGDRNPVNNEFRRDYGDYVTLLRATAESINTAYVDLVATQVKASAVLDAATRAGIPKNAPGLKANARIPLGTASVHPIDMADAFATFAAGGSQAPWYVVAEVRGDNDGLLYQAKPSAERVFDTDVMADLTYALGQVVNGSGGSGSAARALDRPAAGKTGTAALRPDTTTSAWFAGYTPQLAAAVAFYKGDGTEDLDGVGGLSTFFGGRYPAQIWTDFMAGALKGEPVERFPARVGLGTAVNPTPTPTPTPTPVTPEATPEPTDATPGPEPDASPAPTATEPASPEPSLTVPLPKVTPQGLIGNDGNGRGRGRPAPTTTAP